jgi:hypothetical protein
MGPRIAAHADPAVELDHGLVVAHLSRIRDLEGVPQLVTDDREHLPGRERLPDVDAHVTASVAGVQQHHSAVDRRGQVSYCLHVHDDVGLLERRAEAGDGRRSLGANVQQSERALLRRADVPDW